MTRTLHKSSLQVANFRAPPGSLVKCWSLSTTRVDVRFGAGHREQSELSTYMPLPKFELPVALSKVTLPPSPLPLPRSLFLFTCASLFGAWLLLIISILDLGYLSMWLNPPASVFTILYHIGVLLVSRRKRAADAPSYFSTTIFSAYLMSIVWLVAFILTIVVLASNRYYSVEDLQHQGLPVTVHSQRVQVVLTLYEMLVVGGMAVKGHSIVEREGPDPFEWRNLENGKVCLACLFYIPNEFFHEDDVLGK